MKKIGVLLILGLLMACQNQNTMKDTGGIIFYKTNQLEQLTNFYVDTVGCELWLDQGGCRIFQFGNMLFGFCQREGEPDLSALVTFFYADKSDVDNIYQAVKSKAKAEPVDNPTYRIYHFYAVDPEGRPIEFQYFWDEMKKH